MYKIKTFLSLKKEEAWINSVQENGYKLVSIIYCLPIYKFNKLEQSEAFIPYVRLDCRDNSMKKDKYEDYVNLFYDSGWKLIKGSRGGGIQYFQQTRSDVTRGIFSDEDSKENMRKRYVKYSYSYAFLFLFNFFIIFINQDVNFSELFNFKSWYITPLTLFDVGLLFLCLFFGIYYLIRSLINKDWK